MIDDGDDGDNNDDKDDDNDDDNIYCRTFLSIDPMMTLLTVISMLTKITENT